jgi:hypothetical protein
MLTFRDGLKYTRPAVKERAGLSRNAKGGNWDTGIVEHENEFIIFANVGTERANRPQLRQSLGRAWSSLVPQGWLSPWMAECSEAA